MGMVAPAMAVVGTVASIASQRGQAASNNRAIRLQQEANNRATQIRLMGLDLQESQIKQQAELDRIGIESRAQLADLSFQTQAIQRNLQAVQQLSSIDTASAERVLASVAKQYEVARAAFLQKQDLAGKRAGIQEEASNQYGAITRQQQELVNALKSGDFNMAAMLARDTGTLSGTGAQAQSAFQQEQYQAMKAMLEATNADESLQQDLLLNSQYADFLNRAIEASLASNQATIAAETAGMATQENAARGNVQIADRGGQRVETLARALLPQAKQLELNQADIDLRYATENIANSRLEAQFGNYANNVSLQRNIVRPSLLGDLAAVATSAVPLFTQMNLFSKWGQPRTPTAAPVISDFPNTTNWYSRSIG
jgi:hypothetical protein